MKIVKVEKQNFVEVVYQQIRDLIISGEWKEGDKLDSESKLGDMFGVSRVVIREALQRLRSEKLIVTRQGLGSFVSNPKNFESYDDAADAWPSVEISEKQFEDFIEFRCCIEFKSIELAVKNGTEADFKKVGDALKIMEASLGDINSFSEADYQFHKAIVDCAHNDFLTLSMKSAKNLIIKTFIVMNSVHDSASWGIEAHRNIYNNLISRDSKATINVLTLNNEYNKARLGELVYHNKK